MSIFSTQLKFDNILHIEANMIITKKIHLSVYIKICIHIFKLSVNYFVILCGIYFENKFEK